MRICIGIIKINSISTIGSLNVGKTIICKNDAPSTLLYPIGPGQSVSSEFTIGGTTPPTPASAAITNSVLAPPTPPPVI